MSYVRSGHRHSIRAEFEAAYTTKIAGIGLGSSASAVTIDTRFLNGASAGLNGPVAGQNVAIKAFSPAPVVIADGAGVVQSATGGATFTNADFNGGTFFNAQKLGLVLAIPASSANEADGNLVCVIGGTGGALPFNRTFALDLSGAGASSVTAQIAVTSSN